MSSTGLGKGLGALIRESSPVIDGGDVHVLPLKDIIPNPNQPRRKFSDQALGELALSIKSQGLLQPILVRPLGQGQLVKYEIVAGERRWRASKLAGLLEVPVVVKVLSDQETLAAALIENLQREDLNPVEEALGIQTLKDEFALSQEDLASQLGKSRSAIANSLRLLSLPKHTLADLTDGKLSSGHARALLSIVDAPAQEYLRNLILEEKLSVREAEGYAAHWKQTGSFNLENSAESSINSPVQEGSLTQAEYAQDISGNILKTSLVAEASTVASDAVGEVQTVRKVRPQSAIIVEIQQRLGKSLNVPVKVTGKETKGKISLCYSSKAELDNLLLRLNSLKEEAPTSLNQQSPDSREG